MEWLAPASTDMASKFFALSLALLGVVGGGAVVAQPHGAVPLSAGQPILEADAVLLGSGWRPSPQHHPLDLDQQRAGVPLTSLSACSGTDRGYCRFDYHRDGRQLSVVTSIDRSIAVPQSVGRCGEALGGTLSATTECPDQPKTAVSRTVPQRSKTQKITPMTMMSQARCRRAQGARNSSATPCRAVPMATCSSTSSPWASKNNALAKQRISTSHDPLRLFSKG